MRNIISTKTGTPADNNTASEEQASRLDSLRLPNASVRWLGAPLNPRQEGAAQL